MFSDHSSVPRKLISCSLRSPRPCVTTIKPCQLNPQVMNPITSASIAAFLAVPEILGIALKGIFFCGHLFTFALSRLTERCYLLPAPTLLFGWLKFTDKTVFSSTDKTVFFGVCYISVCNERGFILMGRKKTGICRFYSERGRGLALSSIDSVFNHHADDC